MFFRSAIGCASYVVLPCVADIVSDRKASRVVRAIMLSISGKVKLVTAARWSLLQQLVQQAFDTASAVYDGQALLQRKTKKLVMR